MKKKTWKMWLALMLTVTLVFGFALQAAASDPVATTEPVAATAEPAADTDVSAPVTDTGASTPAPAGGDANKAAQLPASTPAALVESVAQAAAPAEANAPTTSFTITFKDAAGAVLGAPVTVAGGSALDAAAVPQAPVIEGQGFQHWVKEGADAKAKFELSTPITENLTLVPVYTAAETFTITFKDKNTVLGQPVAIKAGQKLQVNQIPQEASAISEKETFQHWVKEGEDTPFDIQNTPITANITLVPVYSNTAFAALAENSQWKVTYEAGFANPPENIVQNVAKVPGAALTKIKLLPEGTFTHPDGAKFLGWEAKGHSLLWGGQDTDIQGDTVFTAKWGERSTWKVTYEAGFANPPKNVVQNVDIVPGAASTIQLLPEDTFTHPDGAKFLGWEARGYDLLAGGAKTTIQGNPVFTAKWGESSTWKVTYEAGFANPPENIVQNVAKATGEERTKIKLLPEGTFTHPDGAKFLGWEAKGHGLLPVGKDDTDIQGDTVFTAKWGESSTINARLYLHKVAPDDVTAEGLVPKPGENYFPVMAKAPEVTITRPSLENADAKSGGFASWIGEAKVQAYAGDVLAPYVTFADFEAAIGAENVPGNINVSDDAIIVWYVIKDQTQTDNHWHIDGYVVEKPVEKTKVTFTTTSKERVFTATPYGPNVGSLNGETIHDFYKAEGLPAGYTVVPTFTKESVVTFVDDGVGKNGEVPSVLESIQILDENQNDVTNTLFDVTIVNTGVLKVTPKPVYIAATSITVPYNGQLQTAYQAMEQDSKGQVIIYDPETNTPLSLYTTYFTNLAGKAEGTNRGTYKMVPTPQFGSDNPAIYEVTDPTYKPEGGKDPGKEYVENGTAVDRTINFKIEVRDSDFIITPLQVKVEANSANRPFTAVAQTLSGIKSVSGAVNGDTITFDPLPSATGTLPGTYPLEVELADAQINGEKYDAEKSNYVLTPVNGALVIDKPAAGQELSWTITGNSKGYDYDGTEKTLPNFEDTDATWRIDGLPAGVTVEGITVTEPKATNVQGDTYTQEFNFENVKFKLGETDVTELFAKAPAQLNPGVLTINPLTLNVTPVVDPASITIKTTNEPEVRLNYTGFVKNDDEKNAFTTEPTLNNVDNFTFKSGANTAGTYLFAADVANSVAKNGNYNIVAGNPASLTVIEVGALGYNANGFPFAVPESDGVNYKENDKAPVNTADISANGYKFLGWATEPDGEVVFPAGKENQTKEFAKADAANGATLYAVGTADFTGKYEPTAAPHESTYNGKDITDDNIVKSITVNNTLPGDVIWYAASDEKDADGKLVNGSETNPAYKDASNYTVYYQVQRGTEFSAVKSAVVRINPAPVTVAPEAVTIKRGDTLPSSFNNATTGMVNSEPDSVLDLAIKGYTSTYEPSNPQSGEFTLIIDPSSTAANSNYAVTFEPGVLNVTPAWNVVYNANGGKGSVPTDAAYYAADETVTVDKETNPSRIGYQFLGWANAADATAPDYKVGEDSTFAMPNLGNDDAAVKTLYAVWQLDMTGFSLNSIDKVYNGEESIVELTGALPEGAVVRYSVSENGVLVDRPSPNPPRFTDVTYLANEAPKTLTVTAAIYPSLNAQEGQRITSTVKIAPRPLAITMPDAASQIYNANPQEGFTTQYTDTSKTVWAGNTEVGLLPNHQMDVRAAVTETNAGIHPMVLTSRSITSGGVDVSKNYAFAAGSSSYGNFEITKAPLTVASTYTGKLYNGAEPDWTLPAAYTVKGLQGADKVDILGGVTVSRDAGEDAGSYPVALALGTPEPANYKVTINTTPFVITPSDVEVTITPSNKTQVYGDEATGLTAEVRGTFGSDAIEYTLTREPGNTVGTYNITAQLVNGGNQNYSNIKLGTASYEITKRPVIVQAQNTSMIYGDTNVPALTAVESNVLTGDTLVYNLTRSDAANMNAGRYDILVGVSADENPNYTITPINGIFTIAPRDVNVIITPNGGTKVYGQPDPTLDATISGTVSGDALNYTVKRAEGENVGSYEISIALGNNPNYTIKTVTSTFTITPATAYIDVASATKVAGQNDPAFSAAVRGLVNGDTLEYLFNRTPGEEVGSYEITASYTANPNYNIIVNPGALDITANAEGPLVVPVPDTTAPGGGGGAPAPAPAAPGAGIVAAVAPAVVTPNPLGTLGNLFGLLANLDDTQNPLADQTVNIADNEVPLANATPGGAWALINLLLAVGTALISAVLLVSYLVHNRKKKEDDQYDEDIEYQQLNDEYAQQKDENQGKLKKKLFVRLASVLVAVLAILLFIFTEDMTQKMVLLDKWTLWMLVVAIGQVVVAFFARKTQKDDEDEEDARPMNA